MKLGIVGTGQLGRMLAHAAERIGHAVVFIDQECGESSRNIGEFRACDFAAPDPSLVADIDTLTYEFENIPAAFLSGLGREIFLAPNLSALSASSDRAVEKQTFSECTIPVGEYLLPESREEVLAFLEGGDAILKQRRFGYDGKGQAVFSGVDDLSRFEEAGNSIEPGVFILERKVDFVRELSIVGVRSREGEIACYPLAENLHRGGILHRTDAPAIVDGGLSEKAEEFFRALTEKFGYVGVLALELFETTEGDLLANEFAPRVHNSGHWTLDGAAISQFEAHVRAVLGLPLPGLGPFAPTIMLNVLGSWPEAAALEQKGGPRVGIHDYKKSPRPGRKIGHVNILEPAASDTWVQLLNL